MLCGVCGGRGTESGWVKVGHEGVGDRAGVEDSSGGCVFGEVTSDVGRGRLVAAGGGRNVGERAQGTRDAGLDVAQLHGSGCGPVVVAGVWGVVAHGMTDGGGIRGEEFTPAFAQRVTKTLVNKGFGWPAAEM
ncbi:hypothetical protein GCM10022629_62380 [Amorphoplanes auranticolor]